MLVFAGRWAGEFSCPRCDVEVYNMGPFHSFTPIEIPKNRHYACRFTKEKSLFFGIGLAIEVLGKLVNFKLI